MMTQLQRIILSLTLLISCTTTVFAENYLSANGLKIEIGQSQEYLESKLGTPQGAFLELFIWTLKNGNHLAVSFNDKGVATAAISGAKPDFLTSQNQKITLGQDTFQSVQSKLGKGCYHQGWDEQAIDEYVIKNNDKNALYFIFNTALEDDPSQDNHTLTAISLGYDAPLGEQKTCIN